MLSIFCCSSLLEPKTAYLTEVVLSILLSASCNQHLFIATEPNSFISACLYPVYAALVDLLFRL